MAYENLVLAVAASYVRNLGAAGPEELRQRSERAARTGDRRAADVWIRIADKAEELLHRGQPRRGYNAA